MSSQVLTLIGLSILSFLLAGIPTGLVVGKIRGQDIRSSGSGNIGATNAYRTLGKFWGIITFLGDALKALPFMILAREMNLNIEQTSFIGLMAIIAHCYSPYLRFKGGKGVATSFAVFCYLVPFSAMFALIIFLLVFFITGIISISSLTASLCLLYSIRAYNPPAGVLYVSVITTLIVWIKHKDNILRLVSGKENHFKIGLRKLLNR